VNRQAGLAQKLLEIFMRGVEHPLREAVCMPPTEYLAVAVVEVESSMGETLLFNPPVVVYTLERVALTQVVQARFRGAVVQATQQAVKQALAALEI
tara:strand:- start:220 stop:507 length:288 start_codon:yes stop_codon:yes gene_type:complete